MRYFPQRYFSPRYFPPPYFGSLALTPYVVFVGAWVDTVWHYATEQRLVDMQAELSLTVEMQGLLAPVVLTGEWAPVAAFTGSLDGAVADFEGALSMTIKNPKDTMYAGNKRVLNVTVKDQAGALLNLTGYTAVFKVLRRQGGAIQSPAALTLTSSPPAGIYIPTPANGVVVITLATGQTANFNGLYYWELELTDSSGDTNVVATGEMEVAENY